MKKLFTLLVGIILSITILNSQVAPPQAFSFKATIKSSTGQSVPCKIINLRISILKDNISGYVVYSEYFTPTTDSNSQVDLQIGRGKVLSGIFSSIDWSSDEYYLKIEVDIKGGSNYQLLSVTQLLSVPYAMYAGSAGKALSVNYSNLIGAPILALVATTGKYKDLSGKPTFATIATSGSYNDLINKPTLFNGTWSSLTGKPTFATIATSGSYNDLINKPTLFNGTWSSLTGKPTFAIVATSGSYNDLINKPTFDGTWSSLTGKPTFATIATSGSYNDLINKPTFDGTWSSLTGKPTFAIVATSGSYNDLINKPTFDGTWGSLTGKPTFAIVATSGSYNDLINKPTFDGTWSSLTGKPTFAVVATSGSYNDLINKPTFDGTWSSLTGKPTFAIVATSGSWNDITNTPKTLSGYGITDAMSISHAANGITTTDIIDWNNAFSWGNPAGKYLTLSYVPDWNQITNKPTFSEIATSGSYNDLFNLPTLFDSTWGSLTGKPAFSAIAFSASWKDLINTPTTLVGFGITDAMSTSHPANGISSTNISNWNTAYGWGNHAGLYRPIGYVPDWDDIINKPTFALVSMSGSYSDLLNKPALFDGSWNSLTGRPNFSYVAITGKFSDLQYIPYTLAGYGITDAVDIRGNQLINGFKHFDGEVMVPTPINAQDAATKEYVDTKVVVGGANHYIGEIYGGGVVFYVYDNGQHGLIVATADQSTGIRWYGGSLTNTMARADGIGAGLKNTAIIIANQGSIDGNAFAASVCNEYSVTVGGVTYGDWYLPSKYELNLLYDQGRVVGGFANELYWSSTESSSTNAWYMGLSNGGQVNNSKTFLNHVRAIRAF